MNPAYLKFFLIFNITMSHALAVSELWCDIVILFSEFNVC